MSRPATWLALVTVLLWSFAGYLASRLSHIPPFLVVGITLCIGGLIGTVRLREWKVPFLTLAIGIGGIFGYHYFLFSAFGYVPAVEANLINYLWPLLIVVLSPVFLPGYSLRPQHIIGVAIGLVGTALIISNGQVSLDSGRAIGYIYAACAAIIWACYSLLTKRVAPFSSFAVGGFCLFAGLLSLGIWILNSTTIQQTVLNLSITDWVFLVLLGSGPLGVGFFTWDGALKRGDPRIIGSLSYLTPLASTLILIVLGGQKITAILGLCILLIIGGALISSANLKDFRNIMTKVGKTVSQLSTKKWESRPRL